MQTHFHKFTMNLTTKNTKKFDWEKEKEAVLLILALQFHLFFPFFLLCKERERGGFRNGICRERERDLVKGIG
jgi:hypothetical protein